MVSGPITSWQTDGETMETETIFMGSKITANGDYSHEIKRCWLLGRKSMTKLHSILKNQRHYVANKGPNSQGYGFSSSHVWFWELNHEENQVPKSWCFWTVVLEKTLESPLDCMIKPVHPKGNQSWLLIGRDWCWNSNALATWCEELIHWKRPWCWAGLKAGGEGDGRGWDGWMASPTWWRGVWTSSRSCSPWDHRESDTTEGLNWTGLGCLYQWLVLFILASCLTFVTFSVKQGW